jgi:Gpi18-like mannosyltransferase
MQLPLLHKSIKLHRSTISAPLADVLGLFLGTRLLLLAGAYLCCVLFPVPAHSYPYQPVPLRVLLNSWNHWDASHYLHIARYGYRVPADAAFFPLFPLLVRGTALLLGQRAYTLSAIVVSNLAFLGALVVLYRLASDALNERVGRRTLLYLCLFPTAFFFFTGYNEALFLFFSCSTLYAARCQRWLLAGALGCLAALTRSAGALLVVPYAWELWYARDDVQPQLQSRLGQLGRFLSRAWPIALIPLGTLLYCAFCWMRFNDPLAFASVQKFWGRSFTLPWTGIVNGFWQILFQQRPNSFFGVHVLLDLGATLGFLALAILSWRYLRVSYTLWISLLMFYILSSSAVKTTDVLVSNQRFVLEMFPGFLVLALLGSQHPRLHLTIMITFPFLQALLSALFLLNHWIV